MKIDNWIILIILFLAVFDVFIWGQIVFSAPNKNTEVYFLDVGQGDSELAVLPGNVKILKYVAVHECRGCGAQREVSSEDLGKHHGFCYACSARHFRTSSASAAIRSSSEAGSWWKSATVFTLAAVARAATASG